MHELRTPFVAMDSTARRLGWSPQAQSLGRGAAKRVDAIEERDDHARDRVLAALSI